MDEMDYNKLSQINENIANLTKTIKEMLEKINETLECFGDFKP